MITQLPGFPLSKTPEQKVLSAMQQWPHWEAIGHVAFKEYDISLETFHELLPEYQKFLSLALCKSHEVGMFSKHIDLLWHAHLLHTTLYENFLARFYDGKMLHHVPNIDTSATHECTTPEDICTDKGSGSCKTPLPDPPSRTLSRLQQFQQMYFDAYGELPGSIWNVPLEEAITH